MQDLECESNPVISSLTLRPRPRLDDPNVIAFVPRVSRGEENKANFLVSLKDYSNTVRFGHNFYNLVATV